MREGYFWESSFGKDTRWRLATKANRLDYIKRQVFPHAPSPTMTSFLRMDSAIVKGVVFGCCWMEMGWDGIERSSTISRQFSLNEQWF
jgi:hypothetical protein